MSVINSMLRDLDRRHAPSPFKGNVAINSNVQPAIAPTKRIAPRSAMVLCVLIVLAAWSWNRYATHSVAATSNKLSLPAGEGRGEGKRGDEKSAAIIAAPTVTDSSQKIIALPEQEEKKYSVTSAEKSALNPTPLPQEEGKTAHEINIAAPSKPEESVQAHREIISEPTPIIKQQRKTDDDINAERYQFARNALAQNQPQRAYELLRDNPPSLAGNTDYHAVLAAIEQQLGYYADARLRYQQLLTIDQNQASWWLGLALSLDGEHRNSQALAAYQRATQLNSLPEAARQYAAARITALNHSAEQ